ncbi:MAG TPA: phenylalanine--tRNA ligase subunit beta [Candidatus Acidoferrales bacterium]
MKVLYNWLKDFVDVKPSAQELASRLSLAGCNIGAVEDSPSGPALEADLTTNRPDCLGHYGMAREIAALYRVPLKNVTPKLQEAAEKAADAVRVEIESPELCGRFTARVICGVKIQPSPAWLRERLEALGQASINNVVDATNYVMLELGHPLHAFDYDLVAEHRLVIRKARPGEKMKTLDGIERALSPNVCMVTDPKRPVGIGGIMGGGETEIRSSTKNVLLECAWFDPIAVRKATKFLKLHTEASLRFGRGADPEIAELASRRCAEVMQQVSGGQILAGVVDVYPRKPNPLKLTMTRAEFLRVMGADVPDKDIEAIFAALGFAPERADPTRGQAGSLMAAWECTRPSWRAGDIEREIDLVEEVARLYGFDKFPSRLPAARRPAARLPHAEAEDRLRERLVALGYREIVSIPHVDPARDDVFRPESATPVRLANPLAEDASVLRSTGTVSMATALEWNLNHGQRNIRLFEMGRTYRFHAGAPVEARVLTLGATGEAREKSIHETTREYSFADMKGDLDALGQLAGGFHWTSGSPEWSHPARAGRLSLGSEIGAAGQLSRRVAERLKLRQDVFLAELELDPLYAAIEAARMARRYEPLPRFPAVERDFSLLLADGASFAEVSETIRSLGIAEVASIEAVDLFRGGQVPAGKYSLLVRVTFQSHESTLTEAQLTDFSARIVAALEKRLGAKLRAG